MAICGNCKAEGSRILTRWREDGSQYDTCPSCEPSGFERFTMPSDKKIWMGFEANPNEYEKRYDADGVFYLRKPEYRAEQERKLMQETEEERTNRLRAEAKKRAERRTEQMDAVEMQAALRKAEELASWLIASSGADVN
jgi:hypothetical protein